MLTDKFGIGWTLIPVFTSVNPLSNAGTCDPTVSDIHGSGEKLKLLKRLEYGVLSKGLSKLTSTNVSSVIQLMVESSRRV
jgi:hypothetical protein